MSDRIQVREKLTRTVARKLDLVYDEVRVDKMPEVLRKPQRRGSAERLRANRGSTDDGT